ncbi:MAG: addiction module protein [Cyclobacteriaceae bacterium]|nr:addiction module protein [Cyclobacteriaceae bacterium]
METLEIRKQLHDYIEIADERLLKLMYGMMVADKQDYEVPEWHKEIVQERIENYEKNPHGAVSLEEFKSRIEKMR